MIDLIVNERLADPAPKLHRTFCEETCAQQLTNCWLSLARFELPPIEHPALDVPRNVTELLRNRLTRDQHQQLSLAQLRCYPS